MLPSGEFIEVHEPVKEDAAAILRAKPGLPALESAEEEDENGIPSPSARGPMGRARKALNNAFTVDDIPMGNGHGDGHGNGHATADGHAEGHPDGQAEPVETESGESRQLSRG